MTFFDMVLWDQFLRIQILMLFLPCFSCILGSIHDKLFPVITVELHKQDDTLHQKCKQLRHLPPEYIGISKQFCCSVQNEVSVLLLPLHEHLWTFFKCSLFEIIYFKTSCRHIAVIRIC